MDPTNLTAQRHVVTPRARNTRKTFSCELLHANSINRSDRQSVPHTGHFGGLSDLNPNSSSNGDIENMPISRNDGKRCEFRHGHGQNNSDGPRSLSGLRFCEDSQTYRSNPVVGIAGKGDGPDKN
jgi:hypothetical protein